MEILTDENKSAVDLACDAENWDTFDLLKAAADDRYPHVMAQFLPVGASPRRFFPSQFFVTLHDPFDDRIQGISLREFEDMIQRTLKLKQSGQLSELIPYPDRNNHLIGKSDALLCHSLGLLTPMASLSAISASDRNCLHPPAAR
jgi:hypothetical protein